MNLEVSWRKCLWSFAISCRICRWDGIFLDAFLQETRSLDVAVYDRRNTLTLILLR